MKNVLRSTGLLILVLGLFSCSKDDEKVPGTPQAVAIEKTNIPLNFSNGASLTGKNVQRGNIDVKIKSIQLDATKTWTNGLPQLFNYSVGDNFDILNVGEAGHGAADAFITLKDVAIGTNKITASTTAAGAQVNAENHYPTNWVSAIATDASATVRLNALKAANPFATYSGNVNVTIFKPEPNVLNNVVVPMTTNHGRINATFNLTELLVQLEYTATVTITEYSSSNVLLKTFAPQLIENADILTFQWNDVTSTNGAYAKYKIDIREKNNPAILYTYTHNDATTKIDGAVSKSCKYTVNKESILVDLIDAGGFTFTTPWTEQNNGPVVTP